MRRTLTKKEKRWVRDQILPGLRESNPDAASVEVVVLDETDEQGLAQYQTMVMGPIWTRHVDSTND